jgi:hypothetical protein
LNSRNGLQKEGSERQLRVIQNLEDFHIASVTAQVHEILKLASAHSVSKMALQLLDPFGFFPFPLPETDNQYPDSKRPFQDAPHDFSPDQPISVAELVKTHWILFWLTEYRLFSFL